MRRWGSGGRSHAVWSREKRGEQCCDSSPLLNGAIVQGGVEGARWGVAPHDMEGGGGGLVLTIGRPTSTQDQWTRVTSGSVPRGYGIPQQGFQDREEAIDVWTLQLQ
jgi:hypothetical protein